jgi:methyl-accepting chemotaxis protein
MKTGIQLVVSISIVNLIGIGLLAGVTLIQSQREISRMADEHAVDLAAQSGEKISKWFEGYISATRAIAAVMESYKEIPVAQRRDYFNMMLRQALAANPEALAVYTNWAPNALDGMDAEYANTTGHDETGRFIPGWDNLTGETRVIPIVGFSWETLLQTPQMREEYILDIALFPFPGRNVLYADMGNPVWDKETGAFIGAIGIDIELSTLQTMVGEIKPFGDGHAFVFSSSGIVAAHSDPRRLGKNMRESETDTFGPFLDTMVEAVAAGKAASFSYQPPQSDTVMQYYAVPFSIGRVPLPWTLVVAASHNTIMAPVYRMLTISLIIGSITMLLMFIGVLFMARMERMLTRSSMDEDDWETY